jgi:hypothetical protein
MLQHRALPPPLPPSIAARLRVQERDLMPALQQELARLEHFCTARWFGQLAEPMLPVTYRTVTRHYVMCVLPV